MRKQTLPSILLVLLSLGAVSGAGEPASLADAQPWPLLKSSADKVFVDGSTLFFQLNEIPANQQVNFPRLRNRMVAVYLLGDDEKTPLSLKSEPTEWSIQLGKHVQSAPLILVLELGSPPRLGTEPFIVQPDHNTGVINLPACIADTTGVKLRYEPQPHKNTVGYWVNPDEQASWKFEVTHPDDYTIEIFQGCGTGQGGSEVDVVMSQIGTEAEPQVVTFQVEDTGHFQNFKRRKLGSVSIRVPGTYELKIVPKKLAKNAVMDVRHLILTPTKVPDTR